MSLEKTAFVESNIFKAHTRYRKKMFLLLWFRLRVIFMLKSLSPGDSAKLRFQYIAYIQYFAVQNELQVFYLVNCYSQFYQKDLKNDVSL